MRLPRRLFLLTAASSLALPALARAATPASPFTPRTLGDPKARVHVIEYFSLTCTHCAHFANATMPEVESRLITPGTVYYIFRDFPLDRLALTAAMVARSLPPERYAPFVFALFASQNRWAFNPNAQPLPQLEKMAALAGMSSAEFQSATTDKKLQAFILEGQQKAEHEYHIDSTPTFIVNGKPHPGDMPYGAFARLVQAAGS